MQRRLFPRTVVQKLATLLEKSMSIEKALAVWRNERSRPQKAFNRIHSHVHLDMKRDCLPPRNLDEYLHGDVQRSGRAVLFPCSPACCCCPSHSRARSVRFPTAGTSQNAARFSDFSRCTCGGSVACSGSARPVCLQPVATQTRGVRGAVSAPTRRRGGAPAQEPAGAKCEG